MRRDEEHKMQVAVFEWAAHYPQLACMYAIPNGGNRDARTGARLKAEGVKAGMPDICLPVWRYKAVTVYPDQKLPRLEIDGALYIELKTKGGWTSGAQRERIQMLRDAGNRVVICRSAEEAISEICQYTGIPNPFKSGDTTK